MTVNLDEWQKEAEREAETKSDLLLRGRLKRQARRLIAACKALEVLKAQVRHAHCTDCLPNTCDREALRAAEAALAEGDKDL